MKDIRIAIDGPASSGKSTVAKIIAKNLGYTYLDTGAMYRSATYLALQNGLTEENVPEILDQLSQNPISFGKAAEGSGYSRSTSRTRFTTTAYCSGRWYHHGWS